MATPLKDRLARQASGTTQLSFDPTGRDEQQLAVLPLPSIDPDPEQPRKSLGDLADLALSIREHGIIQPIVVIPCEGGRYRILAGERRFAASKSLGHETIRCIVRSAEVHSRLELQLVENLQRKDLHPVEEAEALQKLKDEFSLDLKGLALRVGKSVSSVGEALGILKVNGELLAQFRTSEIGSKSHMVEISKIPDPALQKELWEKADAGKMPLSELRKQKGAKSATKSRKATFTLDLPDARVVVKFSSGESTPERVREVLETALKLQSESH